MPPTDTPERNENDNTWLVVLGAAVLGLAGLFLFRLRSRAVEVQPQPSPSAEPQPSPLKPQPSQPAPPIAPPPPPSVASATVDEALPVTTTFTAHAVRLSLVYATLQYELSITNVGAEPLPPLQVRADLASARATADTREQLAPSPLGLEVKHTTAPLAPGETVNLKGEVRLPLQQIEPLMKGNARFLVPLARFCVLAQDGLGIRRVFTLGPRGPNGTIASIRLDAGPRNLRELEAREIEAARGFALDPVGAQG